jgi:hypothetical protein
MESSRRSLMPSDLVLLAVGACGGEIERRDSIQLLSFLVSTSLGDETEFDLGLTRPFSPAIDEATTLLVLSGELIETASAKAADDQGEAPERRYRVSDKGRRAVETLSQSHPQETRRASEMIAEVRGLSPQTISAVARSYLLRRLYGTTTADTEVGVDLVERSGAQRLLGVLEADR